jgi:peptidoglycan hydrolase CwlO-like protein
MHNISRKKTNIYIYIHFLFKLTLKNSDAEKNIENINSRKHELEEDKLNIQKQMEKKDSEVNDLNTKLNEKTAELQSLKSDKNVLDEQLVNSIKTIKISILFFLI